MYSSKTRFLYCCCVAWEDECDKQYTRESTYCVRLQFLLVNKVHKNLFNGLRTNDMLPTQINIFPEKLSLKTGIQHKF